MKFGTLFRWPRFDPFWVNSVIVHNPFAVVVYDMTRDAVTQTYFSNRVDPVANNCNYLPMPKDPLRLFEGVEPVEAGSEREAIRVRVGQGEGEVVVRALRRVARRSRLAPRQTEAGTRDRTTSKSKERIINRFHPSSVLNRPVRQRGWRIMTHPTGLMAMLPSHQSNHRTRSSWGAFHQPCHRP